MNKTNKINVSGIFLMLVCLFWFGVIAGRAVDHYVVPANAGASSPYTNWNMAATNIQSAVNVATNVGDRVLVSNGVYTTIAPTFASGANNIVVLTNQITLKSVNGPAVTVIDGNYPAITARCVCVSRSTLEGFTVRNGNVNYSNARGGGINISGPGGTVTNCVVYNNYSDYYGGGISILSSTGIVANCTIYSNTCVYNGGGIEAKYPSEGSMINNCVFWRNKCLHTLVIGTTYGGGGLYTTGKNTVKNCLFYQNDSYSVAGGVAYDYWYNLKLENCTIMANTATNSGGGFYMYVAFPVEARNTIIYNNSAGVNYADAWTTNLNVLTNCCIGNTNGVLNWDTSGNITNNPQFIGTANNNYRLSSGSPCINAGLNQNWMTNGVDLDGRMRIRYGTVDMGAYEAIYEGSVYHFH